MEKAIKILAALTGLLAAAGEVINQANKYMESRKKEREETTAGTTETAKEEA